MKTNSKLLHSLISLEDFKTVLNMDDREDRLCRFCLTTATYTIEQYCRRQLLVKSHFEDLAFWGDRIIPLSHYPVREILAVYARKNNNEQVTINNERKVEINLVLIEPNLYSTEPELGVGFEVPSCIVLSPTLRLKRGERSLRVVYKTGYTVKQVPPDLSAACLELAAWNLNRYRGRRIGTTGVIRGNGRDGEHFEMSIPENVITLLEPYKRKVI